jgi:hypothetical protein
MLELCSRKRTFPLTWLSLLCYTLSCAQESLAGMGGGEGKGGGRSSKKPRLVWTTELHQRFLNAVNHLGVKSKLLFFSTL